jgi:hypothetical protein
MPRDAYFSFGDEEPDVPFTLAGPDPLEDPHGGGGFADPRLGRNPDTSKRPPRSCGRRRVSLTPTRTAALLAVALAVVLLGHALAGVAGGSSQRPHGGTGHRGAAEQTAARALAPVHPGIVVGADGRPGRQKAEQGRVQRRRSQTRPHARRHRERRPIGRRNVSARRARAATEEPTSEPTEEQAPPSTQPTEASAAAQAPPAYTPPPEATPEAAPEPASEPAPPGPPHIRDGAHTQEFGL